MTTIQFILSLFLFGNFSTNSNLPDELAALEPLVQKEELTTVALPCDCYYEVIADNETTNYTYIIQKNSQTFYTYTGAGTHTENIVLDNPGYYTIFLTTDGAGSFSSKLKCCEVETAGNTVASYENGGNFFLYQYKTHQCQLQGLWPCQ